MNNSLSQAEPTMLHPENVTCVTVTYGDRRELLRQVLDELLRQGVGKVAVVDNGAHWAVKDELEAAYGAFVDVVVMGRNTGSAGGYAAGIEHALKLGAEYVWLLDDDNRPEPGCLARLLTAYGRLRADHPADKLAVLAFRPEHLADVVAGVPLHRINPRRNSFRGFHVLDIPYKFWRRTPWGRPRVRGKLPDLVDLEATHYGGLFFHRAVAKRCGLPRVDFVLYYDDIEFTYRLTRKGGRIVIVTSAALKDMETSWNIRKGQRLTSSFAIPIHQGTNLSVYYYTRNRSYFETYCKDHDVLPYSVNRAIYLFALAILACMSGKLNRLSLVLEAERDGRAARLGINERFPL